MLIMKNDVIADDDGQLRTMLAGQDIIEQITRYLLLYKSDLIKHENNVNSICAALVCCLHEVNRHCEVDDDVIAKFDILSPAEEYIKLIDYLEDIYINNYNEKETKDNE